MFVLKQVIMPKMPSAMLFHVVWWKFIDVSEVLDAWIISATSQTTRHIIIEVSS
jgi:hypothetical protein